MAHSPQTFFSAHASKACQLMRITSQGTMLVTFHSDLSIPGKGFTFAWTSSSTEAAKRPSSFCAQGCETRTQVQNGAARL